MLAIYKETSNNCATRKLGDDLKMRRGIEAVGVAVALGLTAGACGGDGAKEPEPQTPEAQVAANANGMDIKVSWGENRRVLTNPDDPQYRVDQMCDGLDFVETSSVYWGYVTDRQVGHVACADSVLTPEDFPANP
jgi:hypothetical protein